jgi:hypothetical protein
LLFARGRPPLLAHDQPKQTHQLVGRADPPRHQRLHKAPMRILQIRYHPRRVLGGRRRRRIRCHE